MYDNPPLRRLTIAVDVESYSSRNREGQLKLQHDLKHILEETCANGDLDRMDWYTQEQGDGELAILPPGVVEDRAISEFIHELGKALHHHNKYLNDTARVRLRVAVHQGNIQVGDNGYAGRAAVTVCRLRDSAPVKRALAEHPGSDFVVVVSESIHSDVVEEGTHTLYQWRFDPITVEDDSKGFRATAWLHVPAPVSKASTGESTATGGTSDGTSGGSDGGSSQTPDTPHAAPVAPHALIDGDVSVQGGDMITGDFHGDKTTTNTFNITDRS